MRQSTRLVIKRLWLSLAVLFTVPPAASFLYMGVTGSFGWGGGRGVLFGLAILAIGAGVHRWGLWLARPTGQPDPPKGYRDE